MKGIWMIAMSGYLIWLSVWDVKQKRIPVYLLGMGVVLTGGCVLYMCVVEQGTWYMPFEGMLPGVFLLAGARLTNQVGVADGIVIAQLGAMVGGRNILLVFFFSMLSLSLVCVVLLMCGRAKGDTKIPYLPFLTAIFLIQQIWSLQG